MARNRTVTINKEFMYASEESYGFPIRDFRDNLYNRFSRNMMLLLDAKKPRTTFTNKGRLEPRRAYRYNFSDQIFKQNQHIPTGDTTVIFMIDGSGSMDSHKRIQKCSAICSAFAKAVNDVTKNQIKFEVFVKHAPSVSDEQYGGRFVTLTKVLSNTEGVVKDYDKILKLDTYCPLSQKYDNEESHVSSYTAEFAVLPALRKYMAKRLTTKNAIIVNMTDGGAYCELGGHLSFRSKENGQMRTKYLSQIPHVTIMVGADISKKEIDQAYGKNIVECEDENFVPSLFKMFMGFLENSYE